MKRLRVGINTLFENPAIGTGGITYLRNLVRRLAEIEEHEYVLYVSPENRHLFEIDRPNVRHVLCPFSKERRLSTIAFEQTVLPFLARRDRLDVFHAAGNVAPLWLPCASVLTVHTLHHWVRPKSLTFGRRMFRSVAMRQSVRHADVVIAVSDYVRTKLEEILRLPPGKVLTVHLGAPEATTRSLQERRDVPAGSLLFVSALWPYKNAEVAVRAHALVRRRTHLDRTLVIAGTGYASYEARLREVARTEGVSESVVFLGHVAQAEIAAVYERAGVLIYPSLEEYFGLPALEAMAAGVPIVASNASSLPEVVGDAGVLVPPEDVNAVADAIERVLCDADLRATLVARGRERVRQFTWRRAAEGTADAYRIAFERRETRQCASGAAA
ncbi:MAG: glycosyltransferase family 4 protein [Gaiellaceae bacterium]